MLIERKPMFSLASSAFALPSPDNSPATLPAPGASFGPIKQINAGVLNIGYAESGPGNGRVIILIHGWPYDIHTYAAVAPILAAKGYRVIVPYLRGYGSTRFLSADNRMGGPCHGWIFAYRFVLFDRLTWGKGVCGIRRGRANIRKNKKSMNEF